jgi:hypothetical protein
MGPIGGSGTKTNWPTGVGRNVTWNWTSVIARQIKDPSSCQRGRPTWKLKKVIVPQINVTSGHLLQKGQDTKTNWPTDRRSQCNLELNFRHCTANYRSVLLSERAPYMKNKESNCRSDNCNIWSPAPEGARHQDELADWPSVVMWLRVTCRLDLQDRSRETDQRGLRWRPVLRDTFLLKVSWPSMDYMALYPGR